MTSFFTNKLETNEWDEKKGKERSGKLYKSIENFKCVKNFIILIPEKCIASE